MINRSCALWASINAFGEKKKTGRALRAHSPCPAFSFFGGAVRPQCPHAKDSSSSCIIDFILGKKRVVKVSKSEYSGSRNDGMVEYWNNGEKPERRYAAISLCLKNACLLVYGSHWALTKPPIFFHHSKIPLFPCFRQSPAPGSEKVHSIIKHLPITTFYGYIYSQNGLISTQNGLLSTQNGFRNSQNGLLSTRNGFLNSRNGLTSTRNGFRNSQNGLLSTRNGFCNSQNGLTSTQNGLLNPGYGFLYS